MSSPAAIAGIVVGAILCTPAVAGVLFFSGYLIYKHVRTYPSLLPVLSRRRRKSPAGIILKEETPPNPTDLPASGLNFDNAAFLNAMSNATGELDPDQQSQSHTQHTILSYLSRDDTPKQRDKEISNEQAVRSKPFLIRPEHEMGQHVLKATRRLSTNIPIYEPEDLQYDFSNPAFEQSGKLLQYQTAAVTLQSCWRGYALRRQLPQIRLEKLNKDRLSMLGGRKQTASLANLRFFDVRGYGYIEVEQLYGLEVVRSAVKKLKKKYGNKGRVKMKIMVTAKGVKLFDTTTNSHVATVKIEGISFCSLDPNNRKIFAFINRKKGRNFCHVFQCNEEDSQELVEVCAEAFDRVVRHYEAGEKRPVSKRSEGGEDDTAS